MKIKDEHINLAQKFAMVYYKKKKPYNKSYKEILSFAYDGVVYSYKNKKNTKGSKLFTRYIKKRVWGAIIDGIRKDHIFNTRRNAKITEIVPEKFFANGSGIAGFNNFFTHLHNKDLCDIAGKRFGKRAKKILNLVSLGYTIKEIGKIVGVSEARISQLIDVYRLYLNWYK